MFDANTICFTQVSIKLIKSKNIDPSNMFYLCQTCYVCVQHIKVRAKIYVAATEIYMMATDYSQKPFFWWLFDCKLVLEDAKKRNKNHQSNANAIVKLWGSGLQVTLNTSSNYYASPLSFPWKWQQDDLADPWKCCGALFHGKCLYSCSTCKSVFLSNSWNETLPPLHFIYLLASWSSEWR